jgi:hypothetical protein
MVAIMPSLLPLENIRVTFSPSSWGRRTVLFDGMSRASFKRKRHFNKLKLSRKAGMPLTTTIRSLLDEPFLNIETIATIPSAPLNTTQDLISNCKEKDFLGTGIASVVDEDFSALNPFGSMYELITPEKAEECRRYFRNVEVS